MSLNILKDMSSIKWIIITFSIITIMACVMIVMWEPFATRRALRNFDSQMQHAYKCYSEDAFEVVTNTLMKYITFLQHNQSKMEPFRDIDLLLYMARAKLGYMYLYSGETNSALNELCRAFDRNYRVQVKAGSQPLERNAFVSYITNGMEKLDAKTGAKWKSEYELNPSLVNIVNSQFMSFNNVGELNGMSESNAVLSKQ